MSDNDIIELVRHLRAMARYEHGDMTIADDAAAEIERLRAERDALKTAAREFLTTLGAAMKTGRFHMNGSADMCHFVRQAMQKLDVLAFDREERRPVGLERLHEEAKP
jgi:vancomycin resistance protein YoaR